MPIDVSPPMSGNLQGFQIAPVQQTDPLQTLSQMSQLRTQGLQQQQANLQLKQQQMQMDSNKALMQAAAQGGANWDKTIQLASQDPRTLPGDLMKLTQERLNIQTLGTTLKKAQQDVLATDMDRHLQNVTGVTDQESLDLANQRSAQAGVHFAQPGDPLPGVPQLTTFPSGHPEAMQAYKNSLTMHKDAMEEGLKGAQTAASVATAGESTARAGQATAETAKTQLETGITQAQLDYIKQLTSTPKGLADYVSASIDKTKYPDLWNRAYNEAQGSVQMRDLKGVRDAVAKNAAMASEQEKTIATETDPRVGEARTKQAIATAAGVAPIKVYTSAGQATAKADAAGLTPDDYNRAGEQYTRTGVMPALGRDSITRARIVQAGNQWARDNGLSPSDVVTMQAAYAGDKDSLKKFQSQRDQIVSFEQTAGKNLDLFLNMASKIPDTGVPWLNTPLRNLNANLVGSENMAAVKAARQVADNEIAKVTSGGGLSGVLSDSARREVQDYNPANATFAQTKAVAAVLKQDMANRHGSMDATLSDIKSRIGGGGMQGGAGTQPQGGQQGGPPLIKTKAEFDALPSGTLYMESNGKTYRKP